MTHDQTEYDIAAIRRLLTSAFMPEELRRFCQDRSHFASVLPCFGPGMGLDDMVAEVIDYCQTRLLWDELLVAVKEVNPRQYARFAPYRRAAPASLLRHLPRASAGLHPDRPAGRRIVAAMGGGLVLVLVVVLVVTFGPWAGDGTPIPPATADIAGMPAAAEGGAATLAFVSDRDGNWDLYLMDTYSGDVDRLTDHPAKDIAPDWSPDSRALAFASERDGAWNIHVLDMGSGAVRRLTAGGSVDADPDWSPDGFAIAFASYRDGNGEIYVMNADGTGQRNLTQAASNEWGPTWSPDGGQIAYVSNRDGNNEIYVMDADGTGRTRLTRNAGWDGVPAWSPDGRWIAFVSELSGDRALCLISPTGDAIRRLASATLYGYPDWSPDGRQIAYVYEYTRDYQYQVYTVDVESGTVKELTNRPGFDSYPAWQPHASP